MATQNIRWRLAAEGGDKVVAEGKRVEQGLVQGQTAVASATEKAIAASDRQIEKLRQVAQQAASTTDTQRRIEALAGGSTRNSLADQYSAPGNNSARVSARVFELGEEAYERRAKALKDVLDPLGAAQDRLNDELREYSQLAAVGKISTEQLAQAQTLARGRYDETAAAIARNEKGLTRLALASRLNLTRQASDVFVTAAMGMNPAMIAIQQGPQIMDAWATSGIKVTASMAALTAGVAGAAAGVVLLAAAWKDGAEGAASYDRAVSGAGITAGLTAKQLRDLTVAAADNGDISIKAARDLATQYLATGQIAGEEIGRMVSITKDYASVMGVDVTTAAKDLARAMLDPEKAGREMTITMGLLNQSELDNIETLVEQGRLREAQIILLEKLTGRVEDHSEKVDGITSAWDAAGRSVSDFMTKLGEALYMTDDERFERLQNLANAAGSDKPWWNPAVPFTSVGTRNIRDELNTAQQARTASEAARQQQVAEAQANQRAERERQAREAKDKKDEAAARKAKADADRERREAERLAREALQRARREEDRSAQINLEIARATQDFDGVQRLEDEAAVRTRIRQLVDDGTTAEKARTTALAEQARLSEARTVQQGREISNMGRAFDLEIMRLAGEDRFVASRERAIKAEERIIALRNEGMDQVTAENHVASEMADLEEARAQSVQRRAAAREREWQITLAEAAGMSSQSAVLRGLNREDWIEKRAREIEADQDNPLNFGEGREQAMKEYAQLMRAQTSGAMRDGLSSFISDIRSGGIEDALGNQFERAVGRLQERLLDSLFEMDWSALMSGTGGGGRGDGMGNLFSKGLNFIFGRNARGTDYWSGGPTWVGEEGPELIYAPRGSRITDHASSMAQMRQAGRPQSVMVEVRAVKGDAFEPEVVRISGGVVRQGMATAYAQSVETGRKAAPTAVADQRAYKG